jgi:2'-5' RNA ligase
VLVPDSSGEARPQTARLFFALWPPPTLAEALAGLAGQCVARAGGRATRRETIHLTLAFLGDVEIARIDTLLAAAATVRERGFALRLDRFAIWRHNGIFQAGCSTPPAELGELARTLAAALARAGCVPADGGRRFVPHVTLVRRVRDVAAEPPPCPPLEWHCDRFVLVRSHFAADGASYERLAEFPLMAC